jgi:putative transposase
VADADRGWPKTLVMDNGPEFTGQMFMVWARRCGRTLHFTDPGKPVQNAYIESFHGKLRDGYLNEHWFLSLADARWTSTAWRQDDNTSPLHSGLGYRIPEEYRNRLAHEAKERGILSPNQPPTTPLGLS